MIASRLILAGLALVAYLVWSTRGGAAAQGQSAGQAQPAVAGDTGAAAGDTGAAYPVIAAASDYLPKAPRASASLSVYAGGGAYSSADIGGDGYDGYSDSGGAATSTLRRPPLSAPPPPLRRPPPPPPPPPLRQPPPPPAPPPLRQPPLPAQFGQSPATSSNVRVGFGAVVD
jgi:hypothetical protein